MPIIITEVETDILHEVLKKFYTVPVFYTDELTETSVYDIAYSSAVGGFIPYLFLGFFTDGGEFNKWFFSNARRHEEMRRAIEQKLGNGYNYAYGQIWFNRVLLEKGELQFEKATLHSPVPDQEKATQLLTKVIRPELLSKNFSLRM